MTRAVSSYHLLVDILKSPHWPRFHDQLWGPSMGFTLARCSNIHSHQQHGRFHFSHCILLDISAQNARKL